MRIACIVTTLILFFHTYSFGQWKSLNSPSKIQYGGVSFISADTGYLAGDSGKVYKTTDGGKSWISLSIGYNIHTFALHFTNALEGYAAAQGGLVLTKDGGKTWNTSTGAYSSYMLDVFFLNDSVGFCVGYGASAYKTQDRGKTWTRLNVATNQDLRSVYFINENNGFIAAEYNEILKTTDGGATWKSYPSGVNRILLSIFFTDVNTGYAVGDEIVKTTDGGKTWFPQVRNTIDALQQVYFIDKEIGYAVGGHGVLLTTSNGGKTWWPQYIGSFSGWYGWYGLTFKDNIGYAVGYEGNIAKLSCRQSFVKDTRVTCSSYKWIDGKTYTSSNDTATYILTNATGCDSVITLDLTIRPIDTFVTKKGTVLSAQDSGATYQWIACNDDGFATISGATNQLYTAAVNGSYAVIITRNGCTDTSSCHVVSSIGIAEKAFGNNFRLFPNPTSSNFYIELDAVYEDLTITVKNVLGQIIEVKNALNTDYIELSIKGERGIYFVDISTADGARTVFKVVKN